MSRKPVTPSENDRAAPDDGRDAAFEGLLAASRVPVSESERAELRAAYDTLCALAERVRTPGRDWTAKPMPSFAATPRKFPP